jgi:GNAT superfamily N-acetyltransferase
MGDLLVKLYDLPDGQPALDRLRAAGFRLRRPIPPERRTVARWVESHFGECWAAEAETACGTMPAKCHIAVDEAGRLAGFACHDVTFRGYFGPAGVAGPLRGRGIGTALLFTALQALAAAGHAYAIIGGSGADDFYAKTVGALPIPGSTPGAYPPAGRPR